MTRLRRAKARGWIRQRRIDRAIHHSGEQRGFLQLQIGDRLAKIKLRRGGKSVIAVRQVHLIGVHGENLRLGVAALDLQRQQHLLHLAAEAAVAAVQEKISGKLHGNGARAAGNAMVQHVAPGRPGNAWKVDAPMILEVLVFDGGDRVVENFGDLLPGHQDAALQGEAADELAVVGIDLRDHIGAVSLEGADFRQVAFVNEEQSGGGAERDGA